MDELIKIRAARTILQKGVRVLRLRTPLSFWARGMPYYTMVLWQPTIEQLLEISEIIARMGLSSEQLQTVDLLDSYSLLRGTADLAMEALLISSRFHHPFVPRKMMVRWLLRHIDGPTFHQAWHLLLLHGGIADFMNTTRLILSMDNLNPTTQGGGLPEIALA